MGSGLPLGVGGEMKRIAIFCDGTWNRLASDYATNVQFAAQAVRSVDDAGVTQVTFYDEGVGTTHTINEWAETRLAAAFGWGLLQKIETAYRFLAFNHEPGDEIYVFGFSRGAYTARSLVGLIRKCGIVPRTSVKSIKSIFEFYKRADVHPDSDEAQRFRMQHAPALIMKEMDRQWRRDHGGSGELADAATPINLRYLGVWDTVGALGVPNHLFLAGLFGTQKKYQFHDTKLSSTVQSARHAVAVDERRRSFEPALWDNLEDLNGDDGTRYQQLWFPGDHGSVGGGGDIEGLSSSALLWIVEGAAAQGLAFDAGLLETHVGKRDDLAPLRNVSKPPGPFDGIFVRADREGPQSRSLLAPSTLARLQWETKSNDWTPYRPKTLQAIHKNAKHFE